MIRTATRLAILGTLIGLTLAARGVRGAHVISNWNGGNGIWTEPARWDSDPWYPNNGNGGNTYDAVIAPGIVRLDAEIALENLTLDYATLWGDFTLTLNEKMTWNGGNIRGSGVINANGGGEVSGLLRLFDTTTINNAGSFSCGGNFVNSEHSIISNLAGAQFIFAGDFDYVGGTLDNQGTLVKQAGADDGVSDIAADFDNQGTIDVQSGTLSLLRDGTHRGVFSGGGTIQFASGIHVLEASLTLNTQVVALAGGTTQVYCPCNAPTTFISGGFHNFHAPLGSQRLTVTGGETTLNAAAKVNVLEISGGYLRGSTTLDVNGPMIWSGGTIRGGGVINANGGITFSGNVRLDETRVLNNAADATGDADFYNSGSSVLNNLPDAQFTFAGDGDYYSGTFNNQGTLVKQAGAEDGVSTISAAFHNTGSVDVQSGTLRLDGGGTHTGQFTGDGTLELSNGTHDLQADSSLQVGALLLTGGTTYVGGTCTLGSATIVQGTHYFNSVANIDTLSISGGTLQGGGTLNVQGQTTWTGGRVQDGTVINASGGVELDGELYLDSSAALNTSGTARCTASCYNADGTAVTNLSEGHFTFAGDCDFYGGTFNNQGTLTKQAGTEDGLTQISALLNSSGILDVQSGTLELAGGGSSTGDFHVAPAAELKVRGAGYALGPEATLDNLGTVEVSGGTLAVDGNVSQVAANTLTAGTWIVGNNATLNLASTDPITTNLATVVLTGSGSRFDRIDALADNRESLSLLGGRSFATLDDLNNGGTVTLSPSSMLTVNGQLIMESGSQFVCHVGSWGLGTASGRIGASGNLLLEADTTLSLVPVDVRFPGLTTRILLAAAGGGTVLGTFDHVPPARQSGTSPADYQPAYLGLGVFNYGDRGNPAHGVRYVEPGGPGTGVKRVEADVLVARSGDFNGDNKVEGFDFLILSANWTGGAPADRTWLTGDSGNQQGTREGDRSVDGFDVLDLSSNWTGDPGPAPAQESWAAAQYDPATGQFVVSVANVTSWLLVGEDLLTGPDDPNLALLASDGLITDNADAVGEATVFAPFSADSLALGRIAEPGLPVTEDNVDQFFQLKYTVGLGLPALSGEITVVPEPGTLALLGAAVAVGLALARRRRTRA